MKNSMRKKSPKVLVFCSCYNHEKYVAEAIESVLNQTYRNIEFLIVNDGSTDRSAQIIESFLDDDRMKFINLTVNTSAVGAFKIIHDYIKKSDAKYIAGMSSDDKWKLNKLEKQIEFLEKNPTYKICFTWDEIIFDEGADQSLKSGYSHHGNRDRFKNLYYLLNYCNFYNAVSAVIDRDAYLEIGGYNWTFRNLQDYDFWINMQLKYPVYLMEECLTYYRKHSTNLSTSSTTFMRDRNETFSILAKAMMEMDDVIFKRVFFDDFVYCDSCTELEILAEKIVILIRHNEQVHKQIGFFLYMVNSQNKNLTHILEKKYRLNAGIFHKLTASYGMEYLLVKYTPDVTYECSKLDALLDFNESHIKDYRGLRSLKSSSLRELLYADININHNANVFIKIRQMIWDCQDKLISFDKKLVVVAETNVDDYKIIRNKFKNIAYLAVLPLNEKLFIDHAFLEPVMDDNTERIYLFDAQEHRIRHLWEIEKEDISEIILYGCCNKQYPVMDIIDNVSLAIKINYYPSGNDDLDFNNLKHLIRVCE